MSTGDIDVSVLVPIHNAGSYLRTCLESLQSQTLSTFEAVLVDDGSTDGCLEEVADLLADDNRFRCLSHPDNFGVAIARNTGLKAARGRYVFHLDSDDFLPDDALEILVHAADSDGVDVVMGGLRKVFADTLETVGYNLPPHHRRNIAFEDEPILWHGGAIVLFLWRRSFIEKVHGYFDQDIHLGEDQLYRVAILPKAAGISLLPKVVYCYRVGHPSLSRLGDWPFSKWLDMTRWFKAVAERLSELPNVHIGSLVARHRLVVRSLIAVRDQRSNEQYQRILSDFVDAYRLDPQANRQTDARELRNQLSAVPHYLRPFMQAMFGGDLKAADGELSKLLQTHFDPEIEKALELRSNGHLAEYESLLRSAAIDQPNKAITQELLGRLLAKSGDHEEAKRAFLAALSVDPKLVESRIQLANLYHRVGELDQALEHAERATVEGPEDARAQFVLARMLKQNNQSEKAIKALQKAISLSPNHAGMRVHLAELQAEAGDHENACQNARKALELGVANQRQSALVAVILRKAGVLDEAFSAVSEAINRFGPHAPLFRLRSGIALQQGDIPAAIADAKTAIELASDSTEYQDHLAEVMKAGRTSN